jgi:hypothetical protein
LGNGPAFLSGADVTGDKVPLVLGFDTAEVGAIAQLVKIIEIISGKVVFTSLDFIRNMKWSIPFNIIYCSFNLERYSSGFLCQYIPLLRLAPAGSIVPLDRFVSTGKVGRLISLNIKITTTKNSKSKY